MGAIIADFGKNEDGLNLFRVNGTKAEIHDAIYKFVSLGCEIYDKPQELEKAHKQWSILLKMKIPEIQNVKDG